jgi:tryptophan synthase alpha chain
MTLLKTLAMAKRFRERHADTPLILMGYYNPIYSHNPDKFITDAVDAGVDGLIVVDLPPEEDSELCDPARAAGLSFIRLVTPTTLGNRLANVIEKAGGFVYYVAIAGITGTKSADISSIGNAVGRIKEVTSLPVVTGFGIRTPEQAREAASRGDGVVIGSAIVSLIGEASAAERSQEGAIAGKIGSVCATLSDAVRS